MSKFKKKTQSSYTYDAKSEKTFCDSIPKGIDWGLHKNVYFWNFSEVHSSSHNTIEKKYEKKYTPDVNFSSFDLELKGYLRPEGKKHLERFRLMYPDIDVRIVFHKDLPIRKGAKKKYSDWARLKGYKWCIAKTFDELPEEWKIELKSSKELNNDK